MPVLYKPKFCCQCGEPIERVEWKLWTSRRFCGVCESVQKHYDLIPRAVLAVGIVAGLFGISGFMTRPSAEPARSVQLASAKPAAVTSNRAQDPAVNTLVQGNKAPATLPSKTAPEVPTPPLAKSLSPNSGQGQAEPVYFCGAATKKGTPCSRRVKTPGRCWQHLGQPSMLADPKVRPPK